MSEVEPEARVPGRLEQAVADIFETNGWRQVSMEQLGPDGTETLAMLLFHICPVCSVCVPLGNEENPFPDEHRDWHLGQAQGLDEAVAALTFLLPSSGE